MAMDLNAKAAYIRGLMTGMEFDADSKNGKVIAAMMDLLEEMAATVTEHDDALDQVYDELETLDQDLDDVVSDIYGDDVKYTGKVVGLDMGTGSAFSLLPAQNATGNWIKVVQRLPVRIELDQKQLEQYPLRIGLSTLVSVNTTNRDGQVLANKVRSTPVAVSTAREISLAPVNKLIDDIVKANAG